MRMPGTGVLNARRRIAPEVESIEELRLRAVALPVALLVAALFSRSPMGHALQRMFFGMPLHELGHASAALLLGYPAFPLPWRTPMAETRSVVLILLLLGAVTWLLLLGRQAGRRDYVLGGALLGGAVLLGLLLSTPGARALIAFAGDAGALVLGTLLMATVFTEPDSRFRQGALRWGLLVIGAAAFSDVASSWWAAWRDPANIPLGEMEGVGMSDASTLVETYGWSERALVIRYLWVAGLCLAAIAGLWLVRAVRPLLRERS